MQVFVPYPSPIDVAKCLDNKRLWKQHLECQQILAALSGRSTSYVNHPATKMYTDHVAWLTRYDHCLEQYHSGNVTAANWWSSEADAVRPDFLTEEFCDQHKRRLYTKSPEDYPQFAKFGKSDENWYVPEGEVVKYNKGKKV